MKKRISILTFLSPLVCLCVPGASKSDNQILAIIKPDYFIGQYAGNIGFFSGGLGYDLFNGRLSGNLMIGYVPEEIANTSIVTISQKNIFRFRNFKPQLIHQFYPTTGFSVNMETGNNSFIVLPDRYPDGYYGTNAFTFSFFVGLNYQLEVQKSILFKQIEYYAEIGTLATYVYYAFKQRDYFNPDIWSLAIGMKLKLR